MVSKTIDKQLIGHTTEAYGADPSDVDRTYSFRYKVVDMDDLIPSHTDTLTVNPKYPSELQPRIRERAASRMQIDNMAKNLNAKVLLRDTGFLDTGPMIVGNDGVVESGNGRMLALRKAVHDYPEKYRLYKSMLVNMADNYGLKDDDIEGINHPVLVRERITNVDRVKFAAEANTSNVLAMSPYEQAVQDANRLSSSVIQSMDVGEDESIDQALRKKANSPIVAKFYESIPANERASIVDQKGEITASGLNRLKMAVFTKTYQGESGQRLARTFSESLDPNIKNLENAMFQSLPDMAKAEGLIATGARDKNLSIAPDMAEVIDTYAALKTKGLTVDQYLAQSAMFDDKLNPMQRQVLKHLDEIARNPKRIREFLRDTAGRIENAPAKGQTGMFGEKFDITKEKIVNASINKQRSESGEASIEVAPTTSNSKRLEKPDREGNKGFEGIPGEREADRAIQEIPLAPSTSVQTGLSGFGKETTQVEMFGEVSGKESKRETLVDVEKLKEAEANKPLPGQTTLMGVDVVPTESKTVDGMKYEVFDAAKSGDNRAVVRVTDTDSGHVATLKTYSDKDKATTEFKEAIKAAQSPSKTEKKPHGVRFDAADIDSTIEAAKRKQSDKPQYVFATSRGFAIHSDPPPGTQQYVEVKPDGSTKKISFDDRIKQQGEKWKTKSGESVPDGDPRSAHAEAVDRAINAKIITEDANEWAKKRNQIDLEGFDTKQPKITYRSGNVTIRETSEAHKERTRIQKNGLQLKSPKAKNLGADIVKEGGRRHLRLY
jgi:hypothetical protein